MNQPTILDMKREAAQVLLAYRRMKNTLLLHDAPELLPEQAEDAKAQPDVLLHSSGGSMAAVLQQLQGVFDLVRRIWKPCAAGWRRSMRRAPCCSSFTRSKRGLWRGALALRWPFRGTRARISG